MYYMYAADPTSFIKRSAVFFMCFQMPTTNSKHATIKPGQIEQLGIRGRSLTFQFTDNARYVILERSSIDGDGHEVKRRIKLNMHHVASAVADSDMAIEGMKKIMSGRKTFGKIDMGDSIYAVWDPQDMKRLPYMMNVRVYYTPTAGVLSKYPDGTPRLAKSQEGVQCYGEEGKQMWSLFAAVLDDMEPPPSDEEEEEDDICMLSQSKKKQPRKLDTSDESGNEGDLSTVPDTPAMNDFDDEIFTDEKSSEEDPFESELMSSLTAAAARRKKAVQAKKKKLAEKKHDSDDADDNGGGGKAVVSTSAVKRRKVTQPRAGSAKVKAQ